MGNFAKDINSNFENNRIKAMLNILYTANYISSFQNEFFKQFGLSPQKYNILRILRGAKKPYQNLSKLATIIAPTNTIAIGPNSVSKMAATRSLRANKRGTFSAVAGLTEKSLPGM